MYAAKPRHILWFLLGALPSMAKHGKGDNDGDDTDEDDAVPTTSSGSTSVPSPATSGSPTATATGSPIKLLQPANVTTCQDLTLRWQSSAAVPPLTLMDEHEPGQGDIWLVTAVFGLPSKNGKNGAAPGWEVEWKRRPVVPQEIAALMA
ncbi:hypothetical protein NUW54_g644 [Trametes sanguinea]|uniref:Uncharacterized protein n=1 Tax=Trametes sanguinea TaxID=158606 RepID=A0ACC1Q961_9APHY|nr:hypothetical protein NUW54_g644 [Trametes sanguinea]